MYIRQLPTPLAVTRTGKGAGRCGLLFIYIFYVGKGGGGPKKSSLGIPVIFISKFAPPPFDSEIQLLSKNWKFRNE